MYERHVFSIMLAVGAMLGHEYIRDTYKDFPYLTLLQKILRIISYGFVLFIMLYSASWYILRRLDSVYSINFSFLIPVLLFIIIVFIDLYIYCNRKRRK